MRYSRQAVTQIVENLQNNRKLGKYTGMAHFTLNATVATSLAVKFVASFDASFFDG